MKKIFTAVSVVLTALCLAVCMVGCNGKSGGFPSLVGFVDETIEIGYGETYALQLSASDADGNAYELTASVVTADGDEVAVNSGRFLVNKKCDYIITYTLSYGGVAKSRTVTAKVVAKKAPVVNVDGLGGTVAKGMEISVPAATAYDYFDGELSADKITVKAYQKAAEAEGGDTEVTVENGKFTAAEAGEYYIVYTASNSKGVTGTARITYEAKEVSELVNIVTVDANTAGKGIYNPDIASYYIAAGDDEIKNFTGGYNGNAVKMQVYNNQNYRIKCALAADTVRFIGREYNSVSMWIAVGGLTIGQADFWDPVERAKPIDERKVLVFSQGNRNIGQWIKISMTVDEFAELCGVNDFVSFRIYCEGGFTSAPDINVYVGDVRFEVSAPEITVSGGGTVVKGMEISVPEAIVTDAFDSDLRATVKAYKKGAEGDDTEVTVDDGKFKVEEAGEYYLVYTAINSKGQTVTKRLDYIAKEPSELVNIVTVDENSAGNDIYNPDIPAPHVVYVAADSEEIRDFTGGYKGNAVRLYVANNPNYRIKCELTPDAVRAIAKEYNTVTMWLAVKGITGSGKNTYVFDPVEKPKPNDKRKILTFSADNMGQWVKVSMNAEAFAGVCGSDGFVSFQIWNEGNGYTGGQDVHIYVGDVRFENVVPIEVHNNDFESTRTLMAKEEWTEDGITGDYEGNAVRFTGDYANTGYKYAHPYSEQQLGAMKSQGYTTVTLYVAVKYETQEGRELYFTKGYEEEDSFYSFCYKANSGANYTFNSASDNIGKWIAFKISLATYIEMVRADSAGFKPFGLWREPATWPDNTVYYYFGELVFGKEA